MFKKRGQAALEFLMTYGWAILAAIVVIGALTFFGVFSPGRYAPKAFTLTAPLGGEEFSINTTTVSLVIRNGGGGDIIIRNISLTNTPSGVSCTDLVPTGGGTTVEDGTTETFYINCSKDGGELSSGDSFRADIVVTYQRSGGLLNQTSTGMIRGTVA